MSPSYHQPQPPAQQPKPKRKSPRRVEHIKIACQVCGTVREYPPGEVRKRKQIRYCSITCRGIGRRREGTMVAFTCDHCGEPAEKRRDHLRERNYCSPACRQAAQRVEGAKWRDPAYIKAYHAEYTDKHRERLNAQKLAYLAAHPGVRAAVRRARRAGVTSGAFSAAEWEAMKARYGYRCLCCGRAEPEIRLQADHIIPLSKGGAHSAANIQPLCGKCNRKKWMDTTDYRPGEARS